MKTPFVSNIQRFSLDDGPGIRTTVFFMGCSLHCKWCHNPETISPDPVIQYIASSCTACGRCAAVCPNRCHTIQDGIHSFCRSSCSLCGKCAELCPSQALTRIGTRYAPEELAAILKKDRNFYRESGGGITFSGGEAMLYPDYLEALCRILAEEAFDLSFDTAGNVPYAHYMRLLPYADRFLFDLKQAFSPAHVHSTGVGNERILDNLKRLSAAGARIWIRVPVIPGENDSEATQWELARIIAALPVLPELVQLLPYHRYGLGKYESIGRGTEVFDTEIPSVEHMQQLLHYYTDLGLPAEIS